jgi:hypothetical protein
MLATLALFGALAVLSVGHGFPALAERLDALRDGASSLGDGIGSGLSGGLGNVPGVPGISDATATAVPTPPLAPALGSDAREFAAYFAASAPSTPGAIAHYHAVMSGVPVSLDVTSGVGTDHRDRITTVVAGAAALAGWDSPTADAICATFLPPDAKLQGVTHVAADTEYRYASASLAASFPQADFVNDSYGLLPPGTLTRLDAPPLGSASGVGSCTVSLGAH